jgi:predicted XRE-type DNA-binding protein
MRLTPSNGETTMQNQFGLVRGSGNVFRDFGDADADLEQLRAALAARILRVLDDRRLTVRKAEEITGVAAADFSRIRRATLGRFTVDRLMTILERLDQRVDVTITVRPRRRAA